MSDPLVSIGMPVYNGEAYIRQALDALLTQDYPHFELVISDNASTDGTATICTEYAAKDKRIRYYRNEVNIGGARNLRRALELSQHEYFMWAAHDDLWERGYVSTLLNLLSANPSAALAFSAFNNVDASRTEIRTYPNLFDLSAPNRLERLKNYLFQPEIQGKANPIYGLMRRETAEEAVSILEDSVWGSDMLFVFSILLHGKLVLAPNLLFHKRLILPPSAPVPAAPGRPMVWRSWLPHALLINWSYRRLKHHRARVRRFRELNPYLSGYRRIIRQSQLTLIEKIVLLVLCDYRSLRILLPYSRL